MSRVTRVTDDGTSLSMWIIYNATVSQDVERGYGLREGSRRLKTWRDSFPGERFVLLVEVAL